MLGIALRSRLRMILTACSPVPRFAPLGWTGATLAKRFGVRYPTVQRAETADVVPVMKVPNLFAVQRTLEQGGIVFLDPGRVARRWTRRKAPGSGHTPGAGVREGRWLSA